jgi:hypothetical protein
VSAPIVGSEQETFVPEDECIVPDCDGFTVTSLCDRHLHELPIELRKRWFNEINSRAKVASERLMIDVLYALHKDEMEQTRIELNNSDLEGCEVEPDERPEPLEEMLLVITMGSMR